MSETLSSAPAQEIGQIAGLETVETPERGIFSTLTDRYTELGQRTYAEASATATHLRWAVRETLQEYDIHSARDLGQYAIHSARETLAHARDNFAEMREQGLRGSLRSRAVRFGAAAGIAATAALGGISVKPQEKQAQAQTGGLVGALADALNKGVERSPIEAPLDETGPKESDPTKGGTVLFMPMTMAQADGALGHFPEPRPIDPLPPTQVPPPDPEADVAFTYGDGGARATSRLAGFRGDRLVLDFGNRVGNLGPDTAEDVNVNVLLPGGLNFDKTSPASAGCELMTDDPIKPDTIEEVKCVVDDGDLASNEFHDFDLGVVVDTNLKNIPTSLRVDAQVSAANPVDPDESNNNAATTVDVQQKEVNVDGKGYNKAPDSRSLYAHTEGQFPYAGSLLDENGKPIDAFVFRDEDGKEICRFTADGKEVSGGRDFELTEGCTANIETNDRFPIPDNNTDKYTGKRGKSYDYTRSLLYAPAKLDEFVATGPMTTTVQAGMLLKEGAGFRIGRGISFGERPLEDDPLEHERIIIKNENGQFVLVINKGPRSLRAYISDDQPVTETVRQVLGAASDSLAAAIKPGAPESEFDDLYITVGSGDLTHTEGPFPVLRLDQPDVAPIARPMLIIPPGQNNGEAYMTFERPADLDLTADPLYDLDAAVRNTTLDPKTGKPWIEIIDQPAPALGSLAMTAIEARGRPARMAEVHRGLFNQVNRIIADHPVEYTSEAFFDTLVPNAVEEAQAIYDETGIMPDPTLHPLADLDDNVEFGPHCPPRGECVISPASYDQGELDAHFEGQVEEWVDLMHLAHEKGERVVRRIDFIALGDPYSTPIFWSEKYAGAGAKDEYMFRGRFERLVRSALDLSAQIAAQKYPDMPLGQNDVETIVMVPLGTSSEALNQGDYMSPSSLAQFLQKNPDISAVGLPFFDATGWFGSPEKQATVNIKIYLHKLAQEIAKVRPDNPYIELRFAAPYRVSDTPTGKEVTKQYYDGILTAARAAYVEYGVRFGLDFWRTPGGQTRGLLRGPAQNNGRYGYYGDDVTQAIKAGLSFDIND